MAILRRGMGSVAMEIMETASATAQPVHPVSTWLAQLPLILTTHSPLDHREPGDERACHVTSPRSEYTKKRASFGWTKPRVGSPWFSSKLIKTLELKC